MAEYYLEINEELTEETALSRQPLGVRVSVAGREDALEKVSIFEPFFDGRLYTKELHRCNHDSGTPCAKETL
ncbi:MAG: hypothetical protein KAS88_00385 [Deltaproteobacteria bacterium]|nr:hypothetical protein [Deltaproteobacteria bacterium]